MNYLDNLTARTSTPAEIAQNTNNVKVPAPNINLDCPKDTLSLYEMSEDMQLTKYNYGGAHIYDGTLNGKQTNIRSVFTNPKTCEYEYTIGDKKLIMTNHNFEKYTGTYNGKEFELYTTRNKSKDYTKADFESFCDRAETLLKKQEILDKIYRNNYFKKHPLKAIN